MAPQHLRGHHRPVEPRPVGADDRDGVAALEAEPCKPDRIGAHLVEHLGPGPGLPDAEILVAERRAAAKDARRCAPAASETYPRRRQAPGHSVPLLVSRRRAGAAYPSPRRSRSCTRHPGGDLRVRQEHGQGQPDTAPVVRRIRGAGMRARPPTAAQRLDGRRSALSGDGADGRAWPASPASLQAGRLRPANRRSGRPRRSRRRPTPACGRREISRPVDIAIGSRRARALSGCLMKLASQAWSRRSVTPRRSGPDAVADADRVAGRADLLEQGLARLQVERVTGVAGRVGLGLAHLVAPFRVHRADVMTSRSRSPNTEFLVHSPVASLPSTISLRCSLSVPAAVAELGVDRLDVLRLSGQEQPARAGVERVGEFLEPLPACRAPDRRSSRSKKMSRPTTSPSLSSTCEIRAVVSGQMSGQFV